MMFRNKVYRINESGKVAESHSDKEEKTDNNTEDSIQEPVVSETYFLITYNE